MAQGLPLLVLEPQVQVLAQAAALVQVREPELVREPQLVLQLVQVRVQKPPLVRQPGPPQVRELTLRLELTAVPEQARELRVSRQLKLQQHRLPTAAQERLPYLPVLPMKAPCWDVPA